MYGKLLIKTELKVLTGLHIGGSSTFMAIGAEQNPIVTDPRTGNPIIPGSSLKGKMRTLLARKYGTSKQEHNKDGEVIPRLFGSSDPINTARLQFADAFVSNKEEFPHVGIVETKSENVISRTTAEANPRTIQRVISGVKFEVCIVYDVVNESEVEEDMKNLASAMKLLQMDYLGGHGTRGSGRVSFGQVKLDGAHAELKTETINGLEQLFEDVTDYELLKI